MACRDPCEWVGTQHSREMTDDKRSRKAVCSCCQCIRSTLRQDTCSMLWAHATLALVLMCVAVRVGPFCWLGVSVCIPDLSLKCTPKPPKSVSNCIPSFKNVCSWLGEAYVSGSGTLPAVGKGEVGFSTGGRGSIERRGFGKGAPFTGRLISYYDHCCRRRRIFFFEH